MGFVPRPDEGITLAVPVHPPRTGGATVITSLTPLATTVPMVGVSGGLNVKVVLNVHEMVPVPLVTLTLPVADADAEKTASPPTTQSNAIAILTVCRRFTSATSF